MTNSRYNEFMEVTLNLTQGQKVSFENFQRVDCLLQPEFFDCDEDGNYVFKALSGEYRLLYDVDGTQHIWTERTAMMAYG